MLNQIQIQGRLVFDPELKSTPNGVAMLSNKIAVQRSFKNPNGEKETDFFHFTAWRSTAETIAKYVKKGEMMILIGSLQTEQWTDKNGVPKENARIVVSGFAFDEYGKKEDSTAQNYYQTAPQNVPNGSYAPGQGSYTPQNQNVANAVAQAEIMCPM